MELNISAGQTRQELRGHRTARAPWSSEASRSGVTYAADLGPAALVRRFDGTLLAFDLMHCRVMGTGRGGRRPYRTMIVVRARTDGRDKNTQGRRHTG